MKTMGATMKTLSLASVLRRGALMTALMAPQIALAQDKATTLFKVITVKDEIVIGLSADELGQLGQHLAFEQRPP